MLIEWEISNVRPFLLLFSLCSKSPPGIYFIKLKMYILSWSAVLKTYFPFNHLSTNP